jgi:hypothetical protein
VILVISWDNMGFCNTQQETADITPQGDGFSLFCGFL